MASVSACVMSILWASTFVRCPRRAAVAISMDGPEPDDLARRCCCRRCWKYKERFVLHQALALRRNNSQPQYCNQILVIIS